MIRLAEAETAIPGRLASPPGLRAPAAARQRAKLWTLNGTIHCSVIGTCLTAAELRRVMAKLARRDVSDFSDHDLHAEAVGLSGHQNPCSKLLQKALEQRHHAVVNQFARIEGEAAVMERWAEARRAGDIPGAYWAVLTHPDVGSAGIRQAFGDVHMLSHLIGSANRADIRRLAALEAENADLQAKVERQQARLQEAACLRGESLRALQALAAARPQSLATEQEADGARTPAALEARLATEVARREQAELRLAECTQARADWQRRAAAAEAECAALARELAILERRVEPNAQSAAALPPERVLYVGGRSGSIEQMRDSLGAAGGELLCHDGGLHDHPSLLAGLISRADRVVFPVDCVSHDAALTVKRLCRQAGKPWLPLRSSGVGCFLAALGTAEG